MWLFCFASLTRGCDSADDVVEVGGRTRPSAVMIERRFG